MPVTAAIRMYNLLDQGGCLLLRFSAGAGDVFLLVDFGSAESGNEKREREIACDIRATVGNRPLLIAVTNRNQVSGFLSAADMLNGLNIIGVWLSCHDDPGSAAANAARKAAAQFRKKSGEAADRARALFGSVPAVERMLAARDTLDRSAETGPEAVRSLLQWSGKKPDCLAAGQVFDLPAAKGVRVYVLGPPALPQGNGTTPSANGSGLHQLDTASGLLLDALNAAGPAGDTAATDNFPFSKKFSHPLNDPARTLLVQKSYEASPWRRIDHEWLGELGRLTFRNAGLADSSSLVLAFELAETGKVVLLAGDAQTAKSWPDLSFANGMRGSDLLSRTVLYKAAPLPAPLPDCLHLMNGEELVVLLPVNEAAGTRGRTAGLRQEALEGYNRSSQGRVLRSDTVFQTPRFSNAYRYPFAQTAGDFSPPLRVVYDGANESHLYVEYMVP